MISPFTVDYEYMTYLYLYFPFKIIYKSYKQNRVKQLFLFCESYVSWINQYFTYFVFGYFKISFLYEMRQLQIFKLVKNVWIILLGKTSSFSIDKTVTSVFILKDLCLTKTRLLQIIHVKVTFGNNENWKLLREDNALLIL